METLYNGLYGGFIGLLVGLACMATDDLNPAQRARVILPVIILAVLALAWWFACEA